MANFFVPPKPDGSPVRRDDLDYRDIEEANKELAKRGADCGLSFADSIPDDVIRLDIPTAQLLTRPWVTVAMVHGSGHLAIIGYGATEQVCAQRSDRTLGAYRDNFTAVKTFQLIDCFLGLLQAWLIELGVDFERGTDLSAMVITWIREEFKLDLLIQDDGTVVGLMEG